MQNLTKNYTDTIFIYASLKQMCYVFVNVCSWLIYLMLNIKKKEKGERKIDIFRHFRFFEHENIFFLYNVYAQFVARVRTTLAAKKT